MKVKISYKNLKDKQELIRDIILWARQWAETCSDEAVIGFWNKKIGLINDYSEYKFDLKKVRKEVGEL